jgi:hypothetical protein
VRRDSDFSNITKAGFSRGSFNSSFSEFSSAKFYLLRSLLGFASRKLVSTQDASVLSEPRFVLNHAKL